MAKTPHSSWNLSNIVLQRVFPAVFEFADTAVYQRIAPICDHNPIFDCRPDLDGFHRMLRRDFDDCPRIGRRYQHSRWSFMKQQQLRTQLRIEIDFRADIGWSEGRLG